MSAFCRDCLAPARDGAPRCAACGSPRVLAHPELATLSLAHVDCDAFYASVEKRDDPALRDKPVIVGGGRRGVVAAACYVARLYGVRSAMPMFKALAACPEAVVIRPNMAKYAAASREVRALMLETTPLVEPLSLDEAFLDLAGTERLHRGAPALTLARLARRIEERVGVTVSVGLSCNKFLAKLASDMDKPRGFAVIGRAEAMAVLAGRGVGTIWGVGKVLERRLNADGIRTIGQLQQRDLPWLAARYGAMGRRLYHFARGEDERTVEPDAETKSISAETTFEVDIAARDRLEALLWPLCETVAARLKRQGLAGRTVTLKLKTVRFRLLTRRVSLPAPTQLADSIFRAARPLLAAAAEGTAFRLIGIGVENLDRPEAADPPDLLDLGGRSRAAIERAVDDLRARFGPEAIAKGPRADGDPGRRRR
jgi:DNA polymerase-4